MSFDPIRELVRRRLAEKNLTMKDASLQIGKNGTYIQQYLVRGIPAHLGEIERAKLAGLLEISAAMLMPPELRAQIGQMEQPARLNEPAAVPPALPARDPLLDQIMGLAYTAWFQHPQRERLPIEKLPNLVYTCHMRLKAEHKTPNAADISRRLEDMIAVLAME